MAINIDAQEEAPAIDTARIEVAPPGEYESTYDEETDQEGDYYPDTLKPGYRSVVYDSVQAIATDKGFYYKSYMDSLLRASQAKPPKKPLSIDLRGFDFFNSIFGVIFWIIAIGLFGYLVYKLFLSNSSFLSRNRKNVAADISVATEEITSDPEAQLRNAIRKGNYRLAIRYLYLQTLSRLSEKNFIEISTNKTNFEYVMEVSKHRFANEFAALTLQYEYVWYGEYPVDENLFEQIEGGFSQFNKNYTRS